MSLVDRFAARMAELGLHDCRAVVAVSGGNDSRVLLDLLLATAADHRLDLVVAHADHGIHPDSARVAERVRRVAEAAGLKVEVGQLHLGAGAGETLARQARYEFLERIRRERDASWIIAAHHADDQVETVLMRALKGSGPAGLAAMADRDGTLVRPLLPFRRTELEAWSAERGLETWDDPANRDPRFLRNWLRHDLLPVLRGRLPSVDDDLLRLSRQAAADRSGWDQLLRSTPALDWRMETQGASLAVAGLLAWDGPLATRIVAAAGRRIGTTIGTAKAAAVMALVRSGTSGAAVQLGEGWRAERAFDRIRLVRDTAIDGMAPLEIHGAAGSGIWGTEWQLDWRLESAPDHQIRDALAAWFIPEAMTVRGWQAGERIRPLRGTGRRLVVRCFQEARVPRSRRTGWPVVEAAGRVVWVPGVCRSDDLVPAPGTMALRVEARGR
jgi:tRNA(Ile)-lysidine synthase